MPGYTTWFTGNEMILVAGNPGHEANVRMQLIGGGGELIGTDHLPGFVNYFVGSDSSKWHHDASIYDRIMREHAYPGIDVVYRTNGSELEYDLVVAPSADPNLVKLHFDGAKRIEIDSAGNLILSTAAGEIRQRKPNVFQNLPGGQVTLDGHFVLEDHDKVGFKVAAYDRSKALVIDPAITYSTYLDGTTGGSSANAIAQTPIPPQATFMSTLRAKQPRPTFQRSILNRLVLAEIMVLGMSS